MLKAIEIVIEGLTLKLKTFRYVIYFKHLYILYFLGLTGARLFLPLNFFELIYKVFYSINKTSNLVAQLRALLIVGPVGYFEEINCK